MWGRGAALIAHGTDIALKTWVGREMPDIRATRVRTEKDRKEVLPRTRIRYTRRDGRRVCRSRAGSSIRVNHEVQMVRKTLPFLVLVLTVALVPQLRADNAADDQAFFDKQVGKFVTLQPKRLTG